MAVAAAEPLVRGGRPGLGAGSAAGRRWGVLDRGELVGVRSGCDDAAAGASGLGALPWDAAGCRCCC